MLQAADPIGLDTREEVTEAVRQVQMVVDRQGDAYAGSSASGTMQHGRVEASLRSDIQSGRVSEGAGRRLITEAVVTPDGRIVASGAEGGPGSISRLRRDAALIARLDEEGLGSQWVDMEGGRRTIRSGYFRTVDVLVCTAEESTTVDAIRSGRVSARGRVLALDVKFGSARLEGTVDLRERLGTTQVAVRPGRDVLGALERMGGRMGRMLSWMRDAAPVLEAIGMATIIFDVIQLQEIPERAMELSDEIRDGLYADANRSMGVVDRQYEEAMTGSVATHRGLEDRTEAQRRQAEEQQAQYDMYGGPVL